MGNDGHLADKNRRPVAKLMQQPTQVKMMQATLNFLLISSILWPLITGVAKAGRVVVVCDEKHEFLCPDENKCIPKTKLCNFVNDCSGGADEELCGECEFSMNSPEECGLTLKSDRAFAWHRKEPVGDYPVFFDANEPEYYVELDLNDTMKQYINRHRHQESLIHKPKIIFPHLRPTDNDKCQAEIQMRITEHASSLLVATGGAGDDKNDSEDAYWPRVLLVIVEPKEHVQSWPGALIGGRENRKYKSLDLRVKSASAAKRGHWLTYHVPLGSHKTVWTLELIVEATINSFLVHISSIEYQNCAPIGGQFNEATTDAPLDNVCDNPATQFRCELSGWCIDKSLLCDFGHDCGENDNSDEEFCDDFPGKCDFEDDSLCDWSMVKDNSWVQMSAKYEDQAFYRKTISRPQVDHTFQSKASGGRYLLLNESQLESFAMSTLLGPHVTLNQEARADCKFRFWSNTPSKLNPKAIASPYLTVGRVHLSTDEVFSSDYDEHSAANNGWRRHEILLFSHTNIEETNMFALKVSFGNFASDLDQFLRSGGFLALDDFSFTPGCHLTYHGPVLENTCGDHQFFCRIPTHSTGAHCIPMENYCDFKNDCGLDDSLDLWADDELDCSHECKFSHNHYPDHHKAGCSALDIQDGQSKKRKGEFNHDDEINEAFHWTMEDDKLLIGAQDGAFHAKSKQVANSTRHKKNMTNLEIYLPTFSGSHANCSFEIAYKWSKETKNVQASILLESEGYSPARAELKRLIPDDKASKFGGPMTTVEFGIGHQKYPFKLLLDVYYTDNLLGEKQHSGSLAIYSYRFLNCAFPQGLIDGGKTVEFKSIEDDGDDDDIFPMDYLDYQYGPVINYTCEKGYFQCESPILCIQEELVCDMQLDCQGGGADEQKCTTNTTTTGDKQQLRHWLQYNFDDASEDNDDDNDTTSGCKPLTVPGWYNSDYGSSQPTSGKSKWHVTNGGSILYHRSDLATGPPYDHTLSNLHGKYLATKRPTEGAAPEAGSAASLHSPCFVASPRCDRLIFYIYFWGNQLNRFQVLKRNYFNSDVGADNQQQGETILFELGADDKLDSWRRISLGLTGDLPALLSGGSPPPPPAPTTINEFGIIFRAFSGAGPSDLVALDDISFGPFCLKSLRANSSCANDNNNDQPIKPIDPIDPINPVVPAGNKNGGSPTFAGWLKAGIIIITVAMLVMVSVGCQAKNLLHLTSSWANNAFNDYNNNQETNHLTASGFVGMELSLEDLGVDAEASIFENAHSATYESRQHQF